MRFGAHAVLDHVEHLREMTGRAGGDLLFGLDTRVVEGRLAHRAGATADDRGEGLRIGGGRPLEEDPGWVGLLGVLGETVSAAALVSKIRDLFEAGFFRSALRRV